MVSLQRRRALVCGAGGGIGAATVSLLLERGARVLAADIDPEAAAVSAGSAAESIGVDVSDERQVAALVVEAVRRLGGIDILVNNAALQTDTQSRADGDVEHMSVAAWDAAFAVNVRGSMLTCKHALPHMVRGGGGAIVNVASNLGLRGGLRQAAYAASKAAAMQLTRSIAASHGKLGVRCNAVAPGLTLTEKVLHRLPAAYLDLVREEALTPELGEPADVAAAIVFLASDAARYITGEVLVVDGGAASGRAGLAAARRSRGRMPVDDAG